jgi:hypothetical protein
MLDPVYNFVKLTVSGPYGASDTSISVSSIPSALSSGGFNATWWNSTDYPDPSNDPNAEIIRVTAVSGNTLTITRGAESATGGGVASTKNTAGKTYQLMLGITAKMITDIGNNLQKPWRLVNVDGTINGTNVTFTLDGLITPFDPNSMQLSLARQPQIQGIDYTLSGTTITYITPPPAELAGQPHIASYQ